MSPEELWEKVARAIEQSPKSRAADAALSVVREAMREPSRAMCDMGWSTERGELPMTPRDVWLQMLAASPLREE